MVTKLYTFNWNLSKRNWQGGGIRTLHPNMIPLGSSSSIFLQHVNKSLSFYWRSLQDTLFPIGSLKCQLLSSSKQGSEHHFYIVSFDWTK